MIYAVALVAVAFAVYYFFIKSDTNAPPGPPGSPLVGNAFQLSKRMEVQFGKWADEFGDIYQIKLFGMRNVILNDPKLVKEVFSRESLTGRMIDGYVVNIHGDGKDRGLVRSDGELWEQTRRFTLRQLRDFGFGKTSMENLIMEEVKEVLVWMKSNEGLPVGQIKEKMTIAVVNSLWTLISSERLAHDDPVLLQLTTALSRLLVELAESGGILLFAPWLRHIAPDKVGYTSLRKILDGMLVFSEKAVAEHKKSHSPDFSRDFIDVFLNEMQKKSNDPSSAFYGKEADKNLTSTITDLFLAGADTTSTTLEFTFLYLSSFPEVQKKLQREIEEITGNSRPVSLTDRPSMPYTESVLAEILRCSSIVSFGVPHRTLNDIQINGFDVKKDTIIMSNTHYIHYNKQIWGDPENFRPERFLSPDGKSFKKHEALLAFSVGRRQCLGETLARDTLFLFITNIFQKFTVAPEDTQKVCKDLNSIELMETAMPTPKPYKVVFKERL